MSMKKMKKKLLTRNSSSSSSSSSINIPDPFDFVTANPQLIVEFYGYQGRINYDDLAICIGHAYDDVVREISNGRGQLPMSAGPYVWSAGKAALYLIPDEELTWARWSAAPLAIRRVITFNAYRGTQFVLLWRGLGPVGYGQLVAETPVVSSSSSSSSSSALTVNAIPDPTERYFGSIGLTIKFYGYRGSVSPRAMGTCVRLAFQDILAHVPQSAASMRVLATEYTYSAGGVTLVLVPRETLTWSMWGFVPIWIEEFVVENGLKGTQFVLTYTTFGAVAYGQLIGMSTSMEIGGLPGYGVDAS